jgi:hypothetical protein
MISMFIGATIFNQYIGNWDTSNVTDMSYMFSYAKEFNDNDNLKNWKNKTITTEECAKAVGKLIVPDDC